MNGVTITASNIYDHVSYSVNKNNEGCECLCVSWDEDNITLDRLIKRELCPLFYRTNTETSRDGRVRSHRGPEMSEYELLDLHPLDTSNTEYDRSCILNHGWIDEFKRVIEWENGQEIRFTFSMNSCRTNSFYITKIDRPMRFPKHKIDSEGFFCSCIPNPGLLGHHHPIQRVACMYNIELEEGGYLYVLK